MTSKSSSEAYVWMWLTGETDPVVAGRLASDDTGKISFNYGRSFLERIESKQKAIPIYLPELPLTDKVIEPLPGLRMPSCIRDASPDAWGRRVVINKTMGKKGHHVETADLSELTYLLESGSDRIGALDFQQSPTEYAPRQHDSATLEELLASADRIEKGVILTEALDRAFLHGTSIGGARPKALIDGEDCKFVAKFSSSGDTYSVVKAEYIAMRLAAIAGLKVAPVKLEKASGKDILLVQRFDRVRTASGWERKAMVSALTILGLEEMFCRYASYEDLAEIIRHRFNEPKKNLRELFSRLVFNILVGNNDDHARNHSAFWGGQELELTPAYDICPQMRSGNEASQAMLISGNNNLSLLSNCIKSSHNYLLSQEEALGICSLQKKIIEENWDTVCDEAELPLVDREFFWGRQFVNPYVFT